MPVGQHLDFDMARLLDVFLDEDPVVGEAGFGLADRGAESFLGLGVVARDAHALAAAAGRGLDHHRIADLPGDLYRFLAVLEDAHMAGHRTDPGLLGQFLGFDLVAHRRDGLDSGTYEGDLLLLQRLGEGGVLRQEAVTGMHGLRAGIADRLHDIVDDQIALGRRRRPDPDRLVRHLHMQRAGIGIGIDGDRRNTHAPRGANDAAGDLTPVGNQYFGKHGVAPGNAVIVLR